MGEQIVSWEEEKEKLIKQRERMRAQLSCVSQWFELLEDGTNLQPFFIDHKCSRIAIYGAAQLGEMLLNEIERNDAMKISCFLDRNAERQREKWGIPVYLPDEYVNLPDIDMVVVTAIVEFESIENALLQIRPEIPVVSLNKIIEIRRDEVWYEKR